MIRIGEPPRLTYRQCVVRWMGRPILLAAFLPYALLVAVLAPVI
ncbi:hypothetical protein Cme02nite_37850 [Catellatospora methionotrophica]|uniref:Uncharacterized protein n=1 Tax=Catellatospora methionotrophica TaxID=121620 RepID=A0A8J3PGK2_9ACTN|nr:hypothetical protein [Catellatospora methionotrophica]GIG15453.1 hypothetical protein Cme02nite_37850 [Catellatospora methionotrophica]